MNNNINKDINNDIKDHEYYEMLVSRHQDNDLNDEEIIEMEEHLCSCESCREFQEEISSMSSILLGKKPIVLKENIDSENADHSKKIKIIKYATSMAAALLLFIGVSVFYKTSNNNIQVASSDLLRSSSANSINDFVIDDFSSTSEIDSQNENTASLASSSMNSEKNSINDFIIDDFQNKTDDEINDQSEYTPLYSYFNDESISEEDEAMMSVYIYYMGR